MTTIQPATTMNWVEQIKHSIPEHAVDVVDNIEQAIDNSILDEIDTHACALAAAISAGNGDLAFEISMNGPLLGKEEREAAKAAAALTGLTTVYDSFVDAVDDTTSPEFVTTNYDNYCGVSKVKFEMYALSASIVDGCNYTIKSFYDSLLSEGMNVDQLRAVAKIAAVVNSIGKVAL